MERTILPIIFTGQMLHRVGDVFIFYSVTIKQILDKRNDMWPKRVFVF